VEKKEAWIISRRAIGCKFPYGCGALTATGPQFDDCNRNRPLIQPSK